MLDTATAMTVSAAALAGLAGSGHCFGMCGGLAGALTMRAPGADRRSAALRRALLHHTGRLSGYSIAGALCGFFGAGIQAALDLARLGMFLRVAAGVTIALMALRMLSTWNAFAPLERLGAIFWRKLQPITRRASERSDTGGALLLGLLWGWLPCGMIYSMLLFAMLSGDALRGAAILAAFGAGTLPAMLASSIMFVKVQRQTRQWPRAVAGTLMLAFGGWMVYAAVPVAGSQSDTNAHHHHLRDSAGSSR
jgi:sulfite exporter TauE/SafE